ncbi:peptide chain release factor N(5)-glutamine methyltransferase [Murdochiella sp. Marseille-P8839]|nr:peptide chain release factor N(5)-glutamine methyltransferase [Murdochiella sp. Marseille-P8839]
MKTIAEWAAQLPGQEGYLALSYLLDTTPGALRAKCEESLPAEIIRRYQELVQRRLAGEPLQYAIGEWEFYGHLFHVDARALIPRPETERLVEMVLQENLAGKIIADIGTGTGAIALSIALEAHPQPKKIYATDCSADALALAKENAIRLLPSGGGVHAQPAPAQPVPEQPASAEPASAQSTPNDASAAAQNMIEWVLGDGPSALPETVDILVSNPPYIDPQEKESLQDELRYEPASALFAGEPGKEGLALYQAWIPMFPALLNPQGVVLMEIGDRQGEAVSNLFRKAGFCTVTVHADYTGRDRIVRAKR